MLRRLTPALIGALLVGAALSVTTHRLAAQATGADEAKPADTSTEQLRQDTSGATVPSQDTTRIQGADTGGGAPADRPDGAIAPGQEGQVTDSPAMSPDSGATDSTADDSAQSMRQKQLKELERTRKEDAKSGYEQ